jgi:prefoldin beta subunit
MSTVPEVSPQLQEQLTRLQQLQQTLQIVITQRQQLDLELAETERALAELDKLSDTSIIYKSIGALLVKTDRQTVLKELQERKELLNTRISVLARQEERARSKVKELQQKIQDRLKPPESEEASVKI